MRSERERKPNRVLGAASWGSLALAGVLSAFAAWQAGSHQGSFSSASLVPVPEAAGQAAEPLSTELTTAAPAGLLASPPEIAQPIEVRVYTEGELRRGETLASALDRQDVSPQLVHEIAGALRPVFDFRYARAGDRYRLAQDEHGQLADFDYRRSEWESYTLRRDGEKLVAERIEPDVQVEHARVAGVISNNLYDAVEALGESGELAHDFAEIFAWDVDFSRSVRPGDEFHILYERRYLTGEGGKHATSAPAASSRRATRG